jgi:predicted lipid carrier protein YhbT
VARNLVPTRALTSILMLLWLQGRAFEDRLFDEHSLSRYGYATVPRVDFLALVLKYFAPAVQVARRVLGQVEIPADAEDLLQWLGEAKWNMAALRRETDYSLRQNSIHRSRQYLGHSTWHSRD